jgi:hypothetical protein
VLFIRYRKAYMKIPSYLLLAALTLVSFAACQDGSKPRSRSSASQTGSNNYGYQQAPVTPGTATEFVTDAVPTPTPSTMATDFVPGAAPSPTPATVLAPDASQPRNLPFGTPVQGMPGYVTSPHAPYAGYVDVRGYPPNTEVKDPYSGKIFLVP